MPAAAIVARAALEPPEQPAREIRVDAAPGIEHAEARTVGVHSSSSRSTRPPRGVYFTAFETRFDTMRSIATGSTLQHERCGDAALEIADPRASAAGRHAAAICAISATIDRLDATAQLVGLASGEQQQLVDEAQQLARASVTERGCARALIERRTAATLDVARGEHDQRERRTNLVRDVAEELLARRLRVPQLVNEDRELVARTTQFLRSLVDQLFET